MAIEQTDYLNVAEQLSTLGLKLPRQMALLPEHFDIAKSLDECQHLVEAATIKTVLRNASLPLDEIVEKNRRPLLIQNNSFEIVLPAIFFTYSVFNGDLGIFYETAQAVMAYLTKAYPDPAKENTVKMSYIVETNEQGKCKKFSYEGSVDGLMNLPGILKSIDDE